MRMASQLMSIIGQVCIGLSQQNPASEPGAGESSQDESENGEAQTKPSLMGNRDEQVIEKAGLAALCPNSTRNLTVEQRRNVVIRGNPIT